MKKKILFAIHRLDAGGAEKSLVTLLQCLPLDNYDVTLLAYNPTGIFRSQVPDYVKVVGGPRDIICAGAKIMSLRFWQKCNIRLFLLKVCCILGDKTRGKRSRRLMSHDQYYNEFWHKHIKDYPGRYDIAISYMDGVNYYVMDHVMAKHKILWCHNDYNKLAFVPSYDLPYYEKAEKVFTISDICCRSLKENFLSIKEKFDVIENISSEKMIKFQASMTEEMEMNDDGFSNDKRFKIVSIGRLAAQKGFDMAIDAAQILKDKNVDFCWYILGEGYLRTSLEQQVLSNGLSNCVKFIGVRSNPYPYINKADLFAMTSRYEGKSIALDEAKILHRPIVVTKFPSVFDAIENDKNGVIVDINPQSIADGILKIYRNPTFRDILVENLKNENNSNENIVVDKFMKIINNMI